MLQCTQKKMRRIKKYKVVEFVAANYEWVKLELFKAYLILGNSHSFCVSNMQNMGVVGARHPWKFRTSRLAFGDFGVQITTGTNVFWDPELSRAKVTCSFKFLTQALICLQKTLKCVLLKVFRDLDSSWFRRNNVHTLQINTTRLRWNSSHSSYYDEWLEFHRNLVVYICSVGSPKGSHQKDHTTKTFWNLRTCSTLYLDRI